MHKSVLVHAGQEEALTEESEAALLNAELIFSEETLGETTFYQIRKGHSWGDIDSIIRPLQL